MREPQLNHSGPRLARCSRGETYAPAHRCTELHSLPSWPSSSRGAPEAAPLDTHTQVERSARPGARRFLVRASYLQIYNEVLSDLLKPGRNGLAIREDRKKGLRAEGLSEWVVRSPAEAGDTAAAPRRLVKCGHRSSPLLGGRAAASPNPKPPTPPETPTPTPPRNQNPDPDPDPDPARWISPDLPRSPQISPDLPRSPRRWMVCCGAAPRRVPPPPPRRTTRLRARTPCFA